MFVKVMKEIDPARVFRETLSMESGKDASVEDLRETYAQMLAERIQKKLAQMPTDLDLAPFFSAAVETMRPIRLETEDGRWYAAAVDIPETLSKACPDLTREDKEVVTLQCMTSALKEASFEYEADGKTYKTSALTSEMPKKKESNAIRRFFAAALVATMAFLAPINGQAQAQAQTQTEIFNGGRILDQGYMRVGSGYDNNSRMEKYITGLMHGKDDPVFKTSQMVKSAVEIAMKKKTLLEKLDIVNRFWNQFKYITDEEAYGKPDYWASPSEFMKKRGGDCEDYALAKYWTLRKLGVSADRMLVMVGKPIGKKQRHAILAVRDEKGKLWFLDNLQKKVVAEKDMKFFLEVGVSETRKAIFSKNKIGEVEKMEAEKKEKESAPPVQTGPTP